MDCVVVDYRNCMMRISAITKVDIRNDGDILNKKKKDEFAIER